MLILSDSPDAPLISELPAQNWNESCWMGVQKMFAHKFDLVSFKYKIVNNFIYK